MLRTAPPHYFACSSRLRASGSEKASSALRADFSDHLHNVVILDIELGKTCEWCTYDDPAVAINADMRIGLCDYCARSTLVEMGKPRPPALEQGVIYFIQAGHTGPVKIGWSASARVRLEVMQTAHWERLFLIHTVPGTTGDELDFQARFAEHRIRGEWFEPIVLDLLFGDEAFDYWLDAAAISANDQGAA